MPSLGPFRLSRVVRLLAVAAVIWSHTTGQGGEDQSSAVADPSVVVQGVGEQRASTIARRASEVRRLVFSAFLGAKDPQPWVPPCVVVVHASRGAFQAALGGGPVAARGATSIEFEHDRVSLRRIDVLGDGTDGVPDALAHEMVHVVLADHFTEEPPPRWADEGLATLFDDAAKQEGHRADLRAAAARGQSWTVRELFALELDPAETGRQRVFYGQSASVVRWMLDRKPSTDFIAFLDSVLDEGPDAAVRKHYGIDSLEELDRLWRYGTFGPR